MLGAMKFDELPNDWLHRPLSDPDLASGVLDLVISESARRAGALCVILCDDEDRPVQPITVELSDEPSEQPLPELCTLLAPLAGALAAAEPDGSVLVAIARADGLSITPADLQWQQASVRSFRRVLGVHVVTSAGSRELPRVSSTV